LATENLARQDSRNHGLAWTALAATLLLGIALRLAHQNDVYTRSPDERVHTAFAARIADNGFGVFPTLFAEYEANPDNWTLPSPARLGHLVLFAAMMRATGLRDATAGALVSMWCSILSLFVVAWIGVRFFSPWVAAASVFFLSFSVAELGMARRAWRDLPFGLAMLLLTYVTCEICRKPRRIAWYPVFFLLGMFLMLTKENGLLGYGLCGLWILVVQVRRERWIGGAALLLGGGLLSALLSAGIWTLLAGKFATVISAYQHSINGVLSSAWAKQYESCPWYSFLYVLWLVGPLTAAMALAGTIVILRRLVWDKIDTSWLADFDSCGVIVTMALAFVGFTALAPNVQNLHTMSPADGTYSLLAGIGFCALLGFVRDRMPAVDFRILLMLALLAAGVEGIRDYRVFTSTVVRNGMEDLPVAFIRSALRR